MKTHDLAKLDAYKTRSGYLKLYMLLYLNVFIIAVIALPLTNMVKETVWRELLNTFQGRGITYPFLSLILTSILVATAVFNAVMLPMLNKCAYYSTLAHQLALLIYKPLSLALFYIINGKPTRDYLITSVIIIAAGTLFAGFNFIYFGKRRELFFCDIVKLVTGEEKDKTKH